MSEVPGVDSRRDSKESSHCLSNNHKYTGSNLSLALDHHCDRDVAVIAQWEELRQISVTDSPLCRACMEKNETPTHVMLECTGVTEQREIYLGSPATIPEILSNLGGMLGFWNELGWLE
ncbi:jg1465 [Pararge aegeria aegeria]|uniref:Jg1465 protein n=1 Tax=Pararge aegeria aegeria TaxID=348720 RepID=A0A8S4QIQ2_9NEOP|nr:jg1465 [Pararge aegeria aegeria]